MTKHSEAKATKVPRVTLKYLSKWLDEKLAALEIPFKVVKAERTRFRGMDYEAGARIIALTVEHISSPEYSTAQVSCYFFLHDAEKCLSQGYRLKFTLPPNTGLDNAEIELVKY